MNSVNNSNNSMYGQKPVPYVRIVEQPARSAVRFRYECEGRSAGPIPGVNSSPSCATYPTIQIMNYTGSRAMVVVSCVTVSQPYRQHPHHLVGRVGCHNGICSMIVDNSDHLCTFTHLGIQCAKRNEIASRLKLRKQMQIDPTSGGFEHITKTARGVDLGCVRLCFQVFLEGPEPDKYCMPLDPVISDPVYDKKLLSKLTITDISTNSAVVTGGKVMLFCNYIDEDDIEVLFFECDSATGLPIWQCFANLKPPFGEVHKRVGMSFMAPAYKDVTTTEVVKCYMQLRRTSDHESSDPISFYYLPLNPQHNCPFAEHLANSRPHLNGTATTTNTNVAPIAGYSTKKFKINDQFRQQSNDCANTPITAQNNEESNESKPEMSKLISGGGAGSQSSLLKFEDIDSDIEVLPDPNYVQQKDLTSNDDKFIAKNQMIQNLFNNPTMVNRDINWNLSADATDLNNNPFNGQSDGSDEENGQQFIQNYIQN